MRKYLFAAFASALCGPVFAEQSATHSPCPLENKARGAVMGYLTAMHEHRFDDAYDFVSKNLTDGRSRKNWSDLQASVYKPGKVSIYRVDVRRALAPADDASCSSHAVVPNILSSRDRLNEHGLIEFEIYHVRRDGTQWRVDSQQTLFEDAAIRTWFPEVKSFVSDGEP